MWQTPEVSAEKLRDYLTNTGAVDGLPAALGCLPPKEFLEDWKLSVGSDHLHTAHHHDQPARCVAFAVCLVMAHLMAKRVFT